MDLLCINVFWIDRIIIVHILFTGTTTTLKNHLRTHSELFVKYKGTIDKCEPRNTPKSTNINTSSVHSFFKPKLTKSKQDEITNAIAQMIASDLRPYTCVEDKGFVHLIKLLEPAYVIPSRTTFSRTHVPELYCKIKNNISAIIQSDIQAGLESISITTDGWKSKNGDSYMSLTIHYLNSSFDYCQFNLSMSQIEEKHSAENLRKHIEHMMDGWKISHRNMKVSYSSALRRPIVVNVNPFNIFPTV